MKLLTKSQHERLLANAGNRDRDHRPRYCHVNYAE